MWRSIIIALALICLALLGWYAVRKYPGRVEVAIQQRAQKVLDAKVPGVIVKMSQRDAVLIGAVASDADRKAAEKLVADLSGVKTVRSQIGVGDARAPEPPLEPPKVEPDTRIEPADTAQPPAPDTAQAATPEAAAEPVADTVAPDTVAPDTAAPAAEVIVDTTPTPEVAVAEVVAPAPEVSSAGSLTSAQCKSEIQALVEGDKRITFNPHSGKLTPDGDAKVVQIAGLLLRCPTARGTIEGYHDDYGDPDKLKELTQIRAYNVHKRLTTLGVDKSRFRYIGMAYRNMRYGGKPGQRVLNQRIEFNIAVE